MVNKQLSQTIIAVGSFISAGSHSCSLVSNKENTLWKNSGPYQVLPLWARVDLRAVTMKGYSAIPQIPALVEAGHQIV